VRSDGEKSLLIGQLTAASACLAGNDTGAFFAPVPLRFANS
jgi:hypothetical protein